jgi:hypothetical protein
MIATPDKNSKLIMIPTIGVMIELGIGLCLVFKLHLCSDDTVKQVVVDLHGSLNLGVVPCPPLVAKGIQKNAQLNLSE